MDISGAVKAHFEAKKQEAHVRYTLYTDALGKNLVGIGDHSNVVEEAIKALEDLESADSCLKMLSDV